MLWHKHMSDMIDDPKVRRLVKKFGSDGYAVYNLILERVTKRLTTESPAPDLEESATDIADLLNMDTVRVEEIVWFCIQNDLFGQDEVSGRVLVHKVYKFIQQSETRSKRIREMISAYKASETVTDMCGTSQTCVIELEQNRTRTEQKRIREEKPKKATHPTLSVPIGQTRYDNLCREWGARVVDGYISRAVAYAEAHGKPYVDYAAAAWTYMQRDIKEGKLVARPKDEGPRTFAEAREMEGGLS